MAIPLRLLIIEDSSDDAQLMVRTIQQGGYDVQYERVETEAALEAALRDNEWDLILCDYTLPALNAIRALELVNATGKDLPFIIVSGSIGEEMAIAALRGGAHDFMLKGNLARLVPAVKRELEDLRTRMERREAEKALREAETRYRRLVERIPAITYVISGEPPYRTIYISPQVEQLLGFTPAEWRADPDMWEKQIHPDDRARVLAEDKASRVQGRAFMAEYRVFTRDGRLVWLHDETHHIHDAGVAPFSQGFEFDITQLKLAEEALRETEAQYRVLVEQLPMMVYINLAEDASRAVYISPQVESILGYTTREWLQDPTFWQNTLHPDDRQRVLGMLRHANETGEPFDMELRMVARDGHVVWFRDQAAPVTDGSGHILRWQGLMIDVTAQRQQDREWQAIARLSNALRQTQTVREIAPRLLDETLALMESQQGSIWLRDAAGGKVVMAEQRQWGGASSITQLDDSSLLELVVDHGKTMVHKELRTDPLLPEKYRSRMPPGIGGASVPLMAAGKALGAMFVNVQLPREISHEELRVLGALADLGAYAIHRAQLFDETVKHLDRLAALRSIDIAISSSFDLRMVLNVVLDNVVRELDVDAAAISLLKADTLTLEHAVGRGFWSPSIEGSVLGVGEGLPGRAVLKRDITYIEDLHTSRDPLIRGYLLTEERFVSYYGIPLVAKGKVKGVLEIFHRSRLQRDREWMQFLEALAGQAAIAIDSATTFQDLQRSNMELAMAYDATIEGWSHALDLRDRETEGHTLRVTEMALKLGRAMGMDDAALEQLRRGGLLHDIGKMGVPDSVLLKPGRLSDEEWAIMRRHPQLAYEMLSSIEYLRPALDIPYCHHERWDGEGYPRGLKGHEIPFAARVFAVVDVWDALLTDRPYRPPRKPDEVLAYIREGRGKHFDPAVVDAFLNLMAAEAEHSSVA